MEYVLKGWEPADACKYFEDLTRIPHGSKNEKGVAEYIIKFCEENGLWYQVDDLWNVIVKKPGSKGCEDLPPVLLQGHRLHVLCGQMRNEEINRCFHW